MTHFSVYELSRHHNQNHHHRHILVLFCCEESYNPISGKDEKAACFYCLIMYVLKERKEDPIRDFSSDFFCDKLENSCPTCTLEE